MISFVLRQICLTCRFGSTISARSQLQPDCVHSFRDLPPFACGNVPIDNHTRRAGSHSTSWRHHGIVNIENNDCQQASENHSKKRSHTNRPLSFISRPAKHTSGFADEVALAAVSISCFQSVGPFLPIAKTLGGEPGVLLCGILQGTAWANNGIGSKWKLLKMPSTIRWG